MALRGFAALLVELAAEHGSASPCFADWQADDVSGVFTDVGGQLNVYSDGGPTAFVKAGYKWNADYNATTVNIGFRHPF